MVIKLRSIEGVTDETNRKTSQHYTSCSEHIERINFLKCLWELQQSADRLKNDDEI